MWKSNNKIVLFLSSLFFVLGFILIKFPIANGVMKNVSFLISYILVGFPIIFRAFKNLTQFKNIFDEAFLMTIATLGALLIWEVPEASVVMLFYTIGMALEERAANQSRKQIKSLIAMKPTRVHLIKGQDWEDVKPENVKVGDTILVKPGERIPLDGKIQADCLVDMSPLTGESQPVEKKKGEILLSGSINIDSPIMIRVTKPYQESTIVRIMKLIEQGTERKSRTEKFITRFARYYTPLVVALAVGLVIVMPPLTRISVEVWFHRALIFLVIACPCALVLSIPLSAFGGLGNSAHQGILVKGSNYLERMVGPECIVFDKTGTLTKGSFEVDRILPVNGFDEEELLEIAGKAESRSNHPIARAIQKRTKLNNENPEMIKEFPGKGIYVKLSSGEEVLAGNCSLMQDFNIFHSTNDEEDMGTTLHIAKNSIFCGFITFKDPLRDDAVDTISNLNRLGIKKNIMLTGDNESALKDIEQKLNIRGIAQLLPEQKVQEIQKLKKTYSTVVFIGDGLNDGPVIAASDVGIAMGGIGQDITVEVADVVLLKDRIADIPNLIRIARKTRNITFQNIFLALGVKTAVMALGAAGLATLWQAIFADVGVALLAVYNATRILKFRP